MYNAVAQQSELDLQATAVSWPLFELPAFGEATICHAVPFQCSVNVCAALAVKLPTAQQSDAERHVMEFKEFDCDALVFEDVTIDQALPFQCSINV